MLKIQPLWSYEIAKYPKGAYYDSTKHHFKKSLVTKVAAASILLALAATSCEDVGCSGVVGPPPMSPETQTQIVSQILIPGESFNL